MIEFLQLIQENTIFNISKNPNQNLEDNVIVNVKELKKELMDRFGADLIKVLHKEHILRIVISRELDEIVPWLEDISGAVNVTINDPRTIDLEFEMEIIIAK